MADSRGKVSIRLRAIGSGQFSIQASLSGPLNRIKFHDDAPIEVQSEGRIRSEEPPLEFATGGLPCEQTE
jgi:hypothetical protein